MRRITTFSFVCILLVMAGCVLWDCIAKKELLNHHEYLIALEGQKIYRGYFEVYNGISTEENIRIEYLRPLEDKKITAMAFYAPFGNAQNALAREDLFRLTTDHNMLLFTIAFDYEIEKKQSASKSYSSPSSGWFERVFELQETLERRFNLSHNKLFIIGDSAGATMANQLVATYPDKIAAAAWCGTPELAAYKTASHPPILAMQVWGDVGVTEVSQAIDSNIENDEYSLFMLANPDWKSKNSKSFHHGGGPLSFTIMREFLAGVANNQNIEKWSNSIEENGKTMPSPSEEFTTLWNLYPHKKIKKLLKEEIGTNKLLELKFNHSTAKESILFLEPLEWQERTWLLDNLFFWAEKNIIAYATTNYGEMTKEHIVTFLTKSKEDNLTPLLICGNNAEAVVNLSADDLSQLERIYIINPAEEDFASLLKIPNVLILSNTYKAKESLDKRVIFVNEPSSDFGRNMFTIFNKIILHRRL